MIDMVMPKQTEMEEPLLEVLYELGGKAKTKDVYEKITTKFPQLTKEDIELKQKNGTTIVWWNRIQWVRQKLISKGEIVSAGHGIWAITNKGLVRIEKYPETYQYEEIIELTEEKHIDKLTVLNNIIDALPKDKNVPVINYHPLTWKDIEKLFEDYFTFFPGKENSIKNKKLIILTKEELVKLISIYTKIKELYQTGLTGENIALTMNISPQQVYDIIRNLDLKREITCIDCGKKIIGRSAKTLRCFECRQIKIQTYYQIKYLRSAFFKVLKMNPDLADRLVHELIEAEGLDFVKLALGDIFDFNPVTGKINYLITDVNQIKDLLTKENEQNNSNEYKIENQNSIPLEQEKKYSDYDPIVRLKDKPQIYIDLNLLTPEERQDVFWIHFPGFKKIFYLRGDEQRAVQEFVIINKEKLKNINNIHKLNDLCKGNIDLKGEINHLLKINAREDLIRLAEKKFTFITSQHSDSLKICIVCGKKLDTGHFCSAICANAFLELHHIKTE